MVAASLLVFVVSQYAHAFRMPFSGDDFLILQRVRGASFLDLFGRAGARIFGWYRPISRELYYWTLRGARESAFHAVSFTLWLAVHVILFDLLRRWTGARAAAITAAGSACLSAWGYALMSVAGAQDLWMLLFGLLFLRVMLAGRAWIGAALLLAALLSKESAIVFPILSLAIAVSIERRPGRPALWTHAPSLLACAAWLALHPTLLARATGHVPATLEATSRPEGWWLPIQIAWSVFDLDLPPAPETGWGSALVVAGVGLLPLLALVLLIREEDGPAPRPTRGALLLWTLLGMAASALPAIGWHPYYAILGLIGAWAMLGAWLARHRGATIAVVSLMALLRAGRASTPSPDWSSEWFQQRSGNALRAVRDGLAQRHPTFPPYTRVYFAATRGAGMVSGSPALGIWYRDSTVRSFHVKDFAVRRPGEHAGPDYFFYFDPAHRPIEIVPSRDGQPPEVPEPGWEGRHYDLGTVLLLGGDVPGAANEYLAVARANPKRVDCALYAAACFRVLGQAAPAERALAIARASGMSGAEAEQRIQALTASFPRAPTR